jgi:hypothetical protein
VNFEEWSGRGQIARVLNLDDDRAFPWLVDTYGGRRPDLVRAVVGHAFTLGARTVVVEYRYLDPDWRNEHKEFYATTYRRYPSVAHRLHFFKEPPPQDLMAPDKPMLLTGMTYFGYSVFRPVPAAPVGRTFLAMAEDHDVTCVTEDRVNLFGRDLTVTGAPFISQDAQLSRCAHTTTWVTAYYHHRRFHGPRVLPGDIANPAGGHLEFGRQLPSPGLTIGQIADASRAIGLPPLVYPLRHLVGDETPPKIICRYLNGGLPVTVSTRSHAFVLVGYGRTQGPDGRSRIHFLRQDDEAGPYQRVSEWRLDGYGEWEYAIVPLPAKVYIAGEDAEVLGAARITSTLERSLTADAGDLAERLAIEDPSDPHRPSFRSTALFSNAFKSSLETRGYPPDIAAVYQRMPMSRYVWVIELTDRALRDDPAGERRCVVAEAVIDATDHMRDPHVLAWRVPGGMWRWSPDEDRTSRLLSLPQIAPTESVASTRKAR